MHLKHNSCSYALKLSFHNYHVTTMKQKINLKQVFRQIYRFEKKGLVDLVYCCKFIYPTNISRGNHHLHVLFTWNTCMALAGKLAIFN